MSARTSIDVHDSGPNIFADLGLPDAGPHFLKAQIVAELYRLASERKLTPSWVSPNPRSHACSKAISASIRWNA